MMDIGLAKLEPGLDVLDEQVLAEVNALIGQLSRTFRVVSAAGLHALLANPSIEVWVVRTRGTIIGMGSLVHLPTLTNTYARIDDVVIDEDHRGRGLGELLSRKLIDRARARGAKGIDLTSGPDRAAANRLYRRLGFELRESSAYRLYF